MLKICELAFAFGALLLKGPSQLLMKLTAAVQLNRPDVQKVVLCALLEDPTVQDLIRDRNRVILVLTLFSSVTMGVSLSEGPAVVADA